MALIDIIKSLSNKARQNTGNVVSGVKRPLLNVSRSLPQQTQSGLEGVSQPFQNINLQNILKNVSRGAIIPPAQNILQRRPVNVQSLLNGASGGVVIPKIAPTPTRSIQSNILSGLTLGSPSQQATARVPYVGKTFNFIGSLAAPRSIFGQLNQTNRDVLAVQNKTRGLTPNVASRLLGVNLTDQEKDLAKKGFQMEALGVVDPSSGIKNITTKTLSKKIIDDFKTQAAMQLSVDNAKAANKLLKLNLSGVKNTDELISTTLNKLGKYSKDNNVQIAVNNWGKSMNTLMQEMPEKFGTTIPNISIEDKVKNLTQPLYKTVKSGMDDIAKLNSYNELQKIQKQKNSLLERLRIAVSEPTKQPLESRLPDIQKKLQVIEQKEKELSNSIPQFNFEAWKDKPQFALTRETFERNIEEVAGSDAPKIKQFIVDPIRDNETNRIEFLQNIKKQFNEKIVKELKIKPKSKEDKLVQRFGEGRITIEDLKKELPKSWNRVQDAAIYFRKTYDTLLDSLNSVRNDFGYDNIPKREDYFRHFQELGGLIKQFKNIRESDLPTEIAGITDVFKPYKPSTSAELQRKGGKFTESAIGGMDNYLDSISKQLFHLPSVQRVRSLESYIRKAAENNPNIKIPNFEANLSEYGNLLSGKKAKIDRGIEDYLGRKIYDISRAFGDKIGKNLIAANINASLTNFIPLTYAASTTNKTQLIKGLTETLGSPFMKDIRLIDGVKSKFLTRRFQISQRIANTKMQKLENAAFSPFQLIDRFVSRSIVSAKYYENIAKGLKPNEAIKLADEYAGKVIADRSFGQTPNLMNAQTLKAITQFQTEINNTYSFIKKDIPKLSQGKKLKIAKSLTELAVYSYAFNTIFEQLTGRKPTIDPINYALTLVGANEEAKDKSFGKRIYKTGKEVVGQLPFVGGITSGRIPLSAGVPDIGGLLQGKADPGEELIKKPFFTLVTPFGGGQLKKTLEGVASYSRGYTKNSSGKVKFPVKQNPQNLLRSLLFGQYSTPEARNYYNKEQTPLGENDSKLIDRLSNEKALEVYNRIIKQRELEKKRKKKTQQ